MRGFAIYCIETVRRRLTLGVAHTLYIRTRRVFFVPRQDRTQKEGSDRYRHKSDENRRNFQRHERGSDILANIRIEGLI